MYVRSVDLFRTFLFTWIHADRWELFRVTLRFQHKAFFSGFNKHKASTVPTQTRMYNTTDSRLNFLSSPKTKTKNGRYTTKTFQQNVHTCWDLKRWNVAIFGEIGPPSPGQPEYTVVVESASEVGPNGQKEKKKKRMKCVCCGSRKRPFRFILKKKGSTDCTWFFRTRLEQMSVRGTCQSRPGEISVVFKPKKGETFSHFYK